MATFPATMASGTIVVIPSNGANAIQTAAGLPSIVLQESGATPYPQFGAQQLGISTSASQQAPQNGPMERLLNAEAKVLGAVQIMIGLIHIGFGAVLLCLFPSYYLTLSGLGGYPFWGGIIFISSGSVCVAAVNRQNWGLVKSSLGLNITSAIMALFGIMLYISEMIISTVFLMSGQGYLNGSIIGVGYGLSIVLLLFSLLEFCITVSLAHFGCRAICCGNEQETMHFVPYQVLGDGAGTPEPNPSPPTSPTYDNMVTKSQ